jgi:hypothetical protein
MFNPTGRIFIFEGVLKLKIENVKYFLGNQIFSDLKYKKVGFKLFSQLYFF